MRLFLLFLLPLFGLSAPPLRAQLQAPAGVLRLVLHGVEFSAERTTVRPDGLRQLNRLADLLRHYPAVRAEIQAHTDASGSTSYNLRLSQKRAAVLRDHLVKKGVPARRITAKGLGESKPLNRCGRGARCSDAEKLENRRVELWLKGVGADSAARAPWLQLAGLAPQPAPLAPTSPKMAAETPAPARQLSEPVKRPAPATAGDYFSELSEGGKGNVPKPLPHTFTGYTIEIACTPKPLPAGAPALRKHQTVYLFDEPGGGYCYYVGAFFTLPEAWQFLQEKMRADFPQARVVAFANETRTYPNQ